MNYLTLLLFPLVVFTSASCVGGRVYEDGKPVCALYGNYTKAYFKSPKGSILRLENADHSTIVKETLGGANVMVRNVTMGAAAGALIP